MDKKKPGSKKFVSKPEFKKPLNNVTSVQSENSEDDLVRLNKFIANSGLCSRREADDLIVSGVITVNGKKVTQLGTKVKRTDKIMCGSQLLKGEKLVYILLNKPKDYITTSHDPQGRKTVLDLVKSAGKERIFPVGRLDRNTTGLLLLTNDGELTDKLTHPKYEVKKLYQVETDKSVKPTDLVQLIEGVELEDGEVNADNASYVNGVKNQIGVELHSGKNRVVRRMFENLGYKVDKLDRVMFAGLSKKDLPRGKYRVLTEKEISFLKMM